MRELIDNKSNDNDDEKKGNNKNEEIEIIKKISIIEGNEIIVNDIKRKGQLRKLWIKLVI